MLKQASVEQVRLKELPRKNTLIVVAMCFYPRGIKKTLIDEYHNILGPDRELLKKWKEIEKTKGHDAAFRLSDYESRFQLSPKAMYQLKKYSEASSSQDIYLVCQCKVGERCHREMLLLTAKRRYKAVIDKVYHSYPTFEKRIPKIDDTLKLW